MENLSIYTCKVDLLGTGKILDDGFESFISKVFELGRPFRVHVVDNSGNGFTLINETINLFIEDCQKPEEERNFANPYNKFCTPEDFGRFLTMFIENYLDYYNNFGSKLNDVNFYQFDVFRDGFVVKVFIPKDLINEDEYMKFLYLGPDFLYGYSKLSQMDIFKYILPAYYQNLVRDDLTNEKELLRFERFQIGLS